MWATLLLNVLAIADPSYHEVVGVTRITSKSYVSISLPNGSCFEVPIINGWMPEITEYYDAERRFRRKLDYCQQIPFRGKTDYKKKPTKLTSPGPIEYENHVQPSVPAPKRIIPEPPLKPQLEKMDLPAPAAVKKTPVPKLEVVKPSQIE